jgi:eukaryotic-like serine/threonine-protein kinase
MDRPNLNESQELAELAAIAEARREAEQLAHAIDDGVPSSLSIRGYKSLRRIRSGGQGDVYTAFHARTGRKVAIKVIRDGCLSDGRMRFDREIRILSQLHHPNIVGVLDAGEIGGQSFFVMEYVAGKALDEFLPTTPVGIRNLILLFLKICQGVNAAHLQGIIHRDLKPSNILIEDATGEPKVLDFGLAKNMMAGGESGGGGSVGSVATMTGHFLGSLPWASPEQLKGAPSQIDVRTDVYSLGLLLYYMLTHQMPYSISGRFSDTERQIAEINPVLPSSYNRDIDDELETMILKCLAKEPERRYQSAGALAEDVERYLAGEAIDAKRASTWYVVRKQVQKHRWGVAVGATFGVVLLVSAILLGILAMSEREARQQEQLARLRADKLTEEREYQLYLATIVAAEGTLQRNEIVRTRDLLEQCPLELRAWEWHRLQCLADQSQMVLHGHSGEVDSVAFSPDGRLLVSGGRYGEVLLWDALTGQLIRRLGQLRHGQQPTTATSVLFHREKPLVAVAGGHSTIQLFDLENDEESTLSWNNSHVDQSLAFDSEGRRLWTFNYHGRAHAWELTDTGLKDYAALDFSGACGKDSSVTMMISNGKIVAAACSDGRVVFLSLDSTTPKLTAFAGVPWYRAFRLHPQTSLLAVGTKSGAIKIVDSKTGATKCDLRGHRSGVYSLQFSPDSRWLVSGGYDETLRVWNLDSCTQFSALAGHDLPITNIAISPDGEHVVSASYDRTLRMWHMFEEGCTYPLARNIKPLYCESKLAMAPDGMFLASSRWVRGSCDGCGRQHLEIWDIPRRLLAVSMTVSMKGSEPSIPYGPYGAVAYSPCGTRVAVMGDDHSVELRR